MFASLLSNQMYSSIFKGERNINIEALYIAYLSEKNGIWYQNKQTNNKIQYWILYKTFLKNV